MVKEIRLRIRRRENPESGSYWEEFVLPYRPKLNVISCLMEIQKTPVNAGGKAVAPVAWECNCLEEVCGACTMIINGKARQACSALIDKLEQPVVLEPLTKFPLVRDLIVDRAVMFDSLRRVKAWISVDGTHDTGPGPRIAESVRVWAYELSRCMTCGSCLEACPQVNGKSGFMGPAVISQVRLMNAHPTGAMNADERLAALMGPGGAGECGGAMNCARACPKGIPLVTSVADVNGQITRRGIWGWLKK